MKAKEVLRLMLESSGMSTGAVAVAMGKSKRYLHPILYSNADKSPQVDNFATMCDVMGYDLLARSREDGTEYVIDPPE